MQARIREYTDIFLDEMDVRRIRKGNTTHKHIKGMHFAIHMKDKDWKIHRKIVKLQQKIKELQTQKR